MTDPNLSKLLQWSLANQGENQEGQSTEGRQAPPLDPALLSALFGGGPSDADLMKAAIECVASSDSEITLESKLIAFDNFEQLIENLDNANNIATLSLWKPLLGCLAHEEAEIRKMAAWCVGTAVQNNVTSQEKLLAEGGIPTLVALATNEAEDKTVRRKSVYALSSACRNYQPAMDLAVEELGKKGYEHGKIDAQDMNAVDAVMNPLKELAK
ncbi:probable Hsp70 nucleotide exchange factor FES1 [Cephalotrichum gorgonifer]|uniref:Probable Hsp70 nucleotide exchange factor FES1 n=1 Tax=Cephalotrichum gorgonifer TaxID=2041049 RepID=A0AAE8STI0_9PEZI|nr:probable Hsp70 nucleotide exchange factor FES1 [Cephalotrichum gorgonifer]